MDQLVELVSNKAGISEAQARKAIETVLKFLEERLPEPIGSRLEDLIEGVDKIDLDKGLDMLSGLFGK